VLYIYIKKNSPNYLFKYLLHTTTVTTTITTTTNDIKDNNHNYDYDNDNTKTTKNTTVQNLISGYVWFLCCFVDLFGVVRDINGTTIVHSASVSPGISVIVTVGCTDTK
jgi:hypothetical protein